MTSDSPLDRPITIATFALVALGLAFPAWRVLLYLAIGVNALWVIVRLVCVMRGAARPNRVAEVLPLALIGTAALATQAIAAGENARAAIITGAMAVVVLAMALHERSAKPQ